MVYLASRILVQRKSRLLSILLFTLVFGCGNNGGDAGSSSGNSSNGDISKLQIIAPKIIYSHVDTFGSGYIVVNNLGSGVVQNISYHLTSVVGSGNNVTIDKDSADNCATIAGYSQCNIKLIVESGAVAGSFGFSASNDTSLQSQIAKVSKASSSKTQIIGVEQSFYNNLSGAGGITLSYYQTVINGTSFILVSGLVASANAGNFNDIVLVDGSANIIPNQQLISGVKNYSQGATFNILLPVPSGNNISQIIKVQTRQVATDGSVTVISTAKSSSTLITASNIGIADILPAAVYLTKAAPEQYITFSNTGDAIAQLQRLIVNNPNIEVVFDPVSLASGATVTTALKLKDTSGSISAANMELTYNNAQKETNTTGVVMQNVNPAPTPSPVPTPSPSPIPSPTPSPMVAGLLAVVNPNTFYKTTTEPSVSQQMTITNIGATNENNIVFTLPDDFTIANGSASNTSCTVTQGSNPATISDNLAANGGSCNVTVIYTNSAIVDPAQTGTISVEYKYDNGKPAPIPATATVSYRVTPATANLSLSPNSPQTYTSIISDDIAVSTPIQYILTNSGDETATNLAFNFGGANGSLFHVITGGTCILGGNLPNISGSNSCTINTQFGPAPNGSAGDKNATFAVGYTPYSGGATTSTSNVNLSGTVTSAPSASFSEVATGIGFSSGDGTLLTPYIGMVNGSYTINVVYTNSSSVTANNFTTSVFTPANGFSRTTHGCNGAQGAMAQNATCTDIYTLNDSITGAHNLDLANITISWTDDSGSYNNQTIPSAGTVYTNLVTPIINVTSVTPNGFVSNTSTDGKTQTKPLALHYNTINVSTATLSLTYKNSGEIDASHFTSSITTLPTGWSLTTHGCSDLTLNANAGNDCVDIYTFTSSPSAGTIALTKPDGLAYTTNFNINDVKLNWTGGASDQIPASIVADSNTSGTVFSNYFLQIFISSNTHNGNFATDPTNIGAGYTPSKPITNADALCANDSNKPNDGYTYKALLSYGNDTATAAQGINRFACGGTPDSAPCVGTNVTPGFDWVLRSGYVQYRSLNSGNTSVVANTLASYGVTSISARPGNFGISSSTWTGLSNTSNYQWTSSTTNNCNGWSDGTSNYTGRKGQPGTTVNTSSYSPMYSSSDLSCGDNYALYCVQQVN